MKNERLVYPVVSSTLARAAAGGLVGLDVRVLDENFADEARKLYMREGFHSAKRHPLRIPSDPENDPYGKVAADKRAEHEVRTAAEWGDTADRYTGAAGAIVDITVYDRGALEAFQNNSRELLYEAFSAS